MKRKSTTLRDETESEIEFQSLFVTNYHLEDNDGEPVCFSVLPFKWSASKASKVDDTKKGLKIFLHGSADNGLQTIFMEVTAWKFDLTGMKPEVSLLSKDKRWIKLQKPRKSFQKTVKTALITLYFLRCAKKNPRISVDSFWSNMCKDKDLSSYGFKPSQKDLLDHMSLIGEATTRDIGLANSKLLLSVLGDKSGDQKPYDEEFDTNNDIIEESDEDSEVEDDLFDSFCALCDNGGNLIMCDGACMRSFHATKADGRESLCDSLGFTKKEVDDIETFYCKNCEYRQHQCFACGELGSSDKDKNAEVFKCASETCDRFYHPHCIAPLVKHVSKDLEKNNADGQTFSCPIHFCCVCEGLENKMDPELQFAVCNRCPKSYHRKCLPTEIAFDDIDDVATRAWEGLLPNNRILIYCLNHEISDELGTPVRDHIKFPDTRASVRDINTPNKKMKPTTTEGVKMKSNVDCVKSSDKSTVEGSKVTGKLPSSKIGSKKSSGETSDKLETPVRDHIKFPDTRATVPEINTSNKRMSPTTTESVELKKNVGSVKSSGKSIAEGSKVTGKLPSSKIGSKKSSGETSDKLETPVRDHIKFPDTRATVPEINTSNKRMSPTTTESVELKKNVGSVKSSGKSIAEGSKVTGKLPSSKIGSKKSSEEASDKLETPVRDHIKFPDTRATVPEINTSNKRKRPTTTESVELKNNVGSVKSSGKSIAEGSKVTGKLPSSKIGSKKSFEEASDKLETPVRDHIKFPDTRATVPEINTSNKRMRPTTTERVELKNNVGSVKSSGKSTAEGSKVTGKLPSSKIGSKKSSEEASDKLETPVRDHIKFPDTRATVLEINTSNKRMMATSTERVELKNNVGFVKSSGKSTVHRSKVTGKLPSETGSKKSTEKIVSGSDISRTAESKEMSSKCVTEYKSTSKNSSEKAISCSDISRNLESNKISLTEENKKSNSNLSGKVISGSHISSKPKSNERSETVLTKNKKPMPECEVKKHPTGQKLCASMNKGSDQIKHDNQVDDADNRTLSIMPVRSVLPPLDADSEKGFVDSFKEARSSILLEGVIKKHKLGDVEDKAITMRKLDDSVDLTTKQKVVAQEHAHMYSDKLAAKNIMESKLDDSVDLTTKQKVIAQEHGHMYGDNLAAENIMDGDSGDKLMPNHDLLKSTDDQELAPVNESKKKSSHDGNADDQEPAPVNESKKKSSHDGNADQESQDKQEFKTSKSSKTSGKRKGIDENDRKAIEKDGRDSSHVNKHSARFAAARKSKFGTGLNVKFAPIHSGGWLEE